MGLSVEVLRLYLNQANLTTSGSKKALVDRMLENGIFPSDMATDSGSGDEQGGIENEALPDNEEASSSGDPHSSGEESHSHADAIRPVVVPARRTKAARPASTARSVSSERPRRRHSVSKRSREKNPSAQAKASFTAPQQLFIVAVPFPPSASSTNAQQVLAIEFL